MPFGEAPDQLVRSPPPDRQVKERPVVVEARALHEARVLRGEQQNERFHGLSGERRQAQGKNVVVVVVGSDSPPQQLPVASVLSGETGQRLRGNLYRAELCAEPSDDRLAPVFFELYQARDQLGRSLTLPRQVEERCVRRKAAVRHQARVLLQKHAHELLHALRRERRQAVAENAFVAGTALAPQDGPFESVLSGETDQRCQGDRLRQELPEEQTGDASEMKFLEQGDQLGRRLTLLGQVKERPSP
jgi:hypothetical protein